MTRRVKPDMEDKLPMKRKGRSPAGKQLEACGVWLDTSALKRRKLQSLIGKPALRRLSSTSSYSSPAKVSFPRTKQTTLSTFFRTQQAEEGETNTKKSLLLVTTNSPSDAKAPQLPAGGEKLLPSSVIQPVVMEKCRQQHVEKPQCGLPGNGLAVQAQRNSCILNSIQEEPTAKERHPLSLDLSQPWEEKRALDYKTVSEPPLRERNGDWKRQKFTSSSSPSRPKRKVASSKRTKPQRSYVDPSYDSENVNPQLEDRKTQTKPSESFRGSQPALFLEASDRLWTADNGPEASQGGAASSLFTQDSEGYRVISHHFWRDRGKLPLQNGPLWGERRSVASPSLQGCGEACYSAARGPQGSPGMTLSVLADIREESCYDLLFTEDSEGNKTIKH